MGSTPKTPEPKSTPLDGLSNEELLAMLKPIQHERATTLAAKLAAVGTRIEHIADALKPRGGTGLAWSGEGAEAFLEWKNATANATLHLAAYAKLAGECLSRSAEAMAVARSGVDDIATTSASAKTDYATAQKALNAARHDPGAGRTEVTSAAADVKAAADAREKARIEALMKLRSLGQTYTFEGQRVNGAERPVFPPPAGYLGKDWVDPNASYIQMPGTSSRSSSTPSTSARRTGDVIGGRADGRSDGGDVRESDQRPVGSVDPAGPARPDPARALPGLPADVPADLGIDSVATLPDAPTVPTTPPGPGPVRPEGPSNPGGNPFLPPTFTHGPVSVPPQLPITGGTAKLPSLRPGPLGPKGPLMPRLPNEQGIVGGRPVPPSTGGRPATGLPRGTVVGNERQQPYGRGGMGGAMGPHGPGGGPGGGNGSAAGRRLATEQGGVVGGRAQQTGRAGSRPFTPGGTGLVRNDREDRSDERAGERPDYLVEDEETWRKGTRPIVPPVVD
ncbi:hypothetical protein [Streptomyces sp. NPDC003943]